MSKEKSHKTFENKKEQNNLEVLKKLTSKLIEEGKMSPGYGVLELILETSTDGYFDWFIQEEYEYMSPRFKQILGYEDYEVPNHPSWWQNHIFKEDLDNVLFNFNKHVETKGVHPYYQEVRYHHKNGSTVHVLCRGRVISWDEDGKPLRMVGTHTDITKIKEAEDIIRKNEEKLDNQKKDDK